MRLARKGVSAESRNLETLQESIAFEGLAEGYGMMTAQRGGLNSLTGSFLSRADESMAGFYQRVWISNQEVAYA